MSEAPTTEPTVDEQVLYRIENSVAWITLNRPESANSITPDQRNRIIDLLEEASVSLEVRAVVLTATGKFFCTGADLRAGRAVAKPRPQGAPDRVIGDAARMIRTGAQRLVSAILDCEKPVIAAVNGTAAGIGAHIAFAADFVIAADNAKFIEVFVRRGIAPDGGGAWLLTRIVGLQKAKELMFFGDDVPAAEALRIGLVNRVVAADELEVAAKEWGERLASGPTKAISVAKRLANRALDVDRATSFEDEAFLQELVTMSADSQEGMKSFVERRTPEFKGW